MRNLFSFRWGRGISDFVYGIVDMISELSLNCTIDPSPCAHRSYSMQYQTLQVLNWHPCFVLFHYFFETNSYAFQTGLELFLQPKMILLAPALEWHVSPCLFYTAGAEDRTQCSRNVMRMLLLSHILSDHSFRVYNFV